MAAARVVRTVAAAASGFVGAGVKTPDGRGAEKAQEKLLSLLLKLPSVASLAPARDLVDELLARRRLLHHLPLSLDCFTKFKEYYLYLSSIQARFQSIVVEPFLAANKTPPNLFVWSDAWSKKTVSMYTIHFEACCVLYNMAALFSELAARQDTWDAAGRLKACNYLQRSIAAFTVLRDRFLCDHIDYGLDLTSSSLTVLIHMMQAQYEECFWIQAAGQDNKSETLSKLAAEIAVSYDLAATGLESPRQKCRFAKSWVGECIARKNYFLAVAHFHQFKVLEASESRGAMVGRLRIASHHILIALKESKKLKGVILTTVRQWYKTIMDTLAHVEREHATIYHEDPIPSRDALPPLERTKIPSVILDEFEALVKQGSEQALAGLTIAAPPVKKPTSPSPGPRRSENSAAVSNNSSSPATSTRAAKSERTASPKVFQPVQLATKRADTEIDAEDSNHGPVIHIHQPSKRTRREDVDQSASRSHAARSQSSARRPEAASITMLARSPSAHVHQPASVPETDLDSYRTKSHRTESLLESLAKQSLLYASPTH